MQENDLYEKQTIPLTGGGSERGAQIEQQLRELALLPLDIKHMSVKVLLQTGAPRDTALIIASYTMPLPLFSSSLIYADLTLTAHQQEQIRKMLESARGNSFRAQKHCRKCHQRYRPEHAVAQILIQEAGENGHDGDTAARRNGRVNRLQTDDFTTLVSSNIIHGDQAANREGATVQNLHHYQPRQRHSCSYNTPAHYTADHRDQ